MKTVLLAGGKGTRISEETLNLPKPMISIGDKPIIWHIINYYSKFNFKDFIICAGYKLMSIKKYFANNENVNVIDTGLNSQTGIRIKKIRNLIGNDDNFFMTYGDGLSNVDLNGLVNFHKKHGKIATLTAVRPIPRFGNIPLNENKVIEFNEKDSLQEGWINGGFFVLEPEVKDYIAGDEMPFENLPLRNLVNDKHLVSYKHKRFWKPMDMIREKKELNKLWESKKAPWKIWH